MPMNRTVDIVARQQALLDFLPVKDGGDPGCSPARLKAWVAQQDIPVSYKTIQRDLEELLAQALVVCDEQGGGRRWWRVRGVQRSQPMSSHEAFLHVLVNQRLRHWLPASLYQSLQPAMLEAEKTLGRPDLQRERSWFQKVQSAQALLPPPVIEPALMQTIISALLDEHWLLACYKKRDQAVQEAKRLMPLGIAEVDSIYYLIARYDGYDNDCHLRIDRFITVDELDEPFSYPREFDLKDYLAGGAFRYVHGEPIVLKLRIETYASQHLIDQPLSDDMVIREDGAGAQLLTATVSDDSRLFWWLLAMGENVTVLEPVSLRERLLVTLQAMMGNYRQAGTGLEAAP